MKLEQVDPGLLPGQRGRRGYTKDLLNDFLHNGMDAARICNDTQTATKSIERAIRQAIYRYKLQDLISCVVRGDAVFLLRRKQKESAR